MITTLYLLIWGESIIVLLFYRNRMMLFSSPRKVYDKESQFQTDFAKILKAEGYRTYKLPDVGYTLKPFDMFAVKDGEAIGIELKLFKKTILSSYEQIYKELRPNQIGGLYNIQKAGGQAWLIGYCNKTKHIKHFNFVYIEDGNKREL